MLVSWGQEVAVFCQRAANFRQQNEVLKILRNFILNSHIARVKNNLKFTDTVHAYVCIKKLNFKMHPDTTLLCSVQPGFFSEFDGENSLPVSK